MNNSELCTITWVSLCTIPLTESTESGRTRLCCQKLRQWVLTLGNSNQKGAIRAHASGLLEMFYFLISVLVIQCVQFMIKLHSVYFSYVYITSIKKVNAHAHTHSQKSATKVVMYFGSPLRQGRIKEDIPGRGGLKRHVETWCSMPPLCIELLIYPNL